MTNKSESIVPRFQGERYHGETMEGDYFHDGEINQNYIICSKSNVPHAIRNKTLQISLDNGINWATMEEVREALELRKQIHEFGDFSV